MTTPQMAWAAGLFEGEGTVRAVSNQKHPYASIRLQLRMTDEDVVKRFAEVVGCLRVNGPYTNRDGSLGNKPMWYWQTSRQDEVKRILIDFWPYLGKRRQAQAQEALGLWGTRRFS
jgi:hypothetical protein